LGLAYKKDIDDVRESPAFEVIDHLETRGAQVSYHDPFVPKTHTMRRWDLEMASIPLTAERLREFDVALIVTDHSSVDYSLVVDTVPLVVDTRNATRQVTRGREK